MRRTTTLATLASLVLPLGSMAAAVAPAQAAGETCDGKAATIVLVPPTTYTTEWVVGTPGDDVIVGTDGNDRIDGAGGDDTICGLDHRDQIIGGPGNDRLFGGDDEYFPDDDYWGDVIQPGPGDDYVDLGADIGPEDLHWVDSAYHDKVSYADAPGPVVVDLVALTATGHGDDTFAPTPADKYAGIIGSPYDDVLTGGPAHDQIHGGGGDDIITGAAGDDDLDGDLASRFDHHGTRVPGSDVVRGGPGDDTVAGGPGTDTVIGGRGDDNLVGHGGSRRTVLSGGAGKDDLSPAPGTRAFGGPGADEFHVVLRRKKPGHRGRWISGGRGTDRVYFDYYGVRKPGYDLKIHVPKRFIRHDGDRLARLTGTEQFVLDGNESRGSVSFRGGPRDELFRVRFAMGFAVRALGGGGADTLIGGYGADFLHGGPGRDRLVGDRGRDRCVAGEVLKGCERRR